MSDTLVNYGWTATELQWRQQAACIGFVDVFFPDRATRDTRQRALLICEGCPVVTECDEYATDSGESSAVWGGMNRTKRFRL